MDEKTIKKNMEALAKRQAEKKKEAADSGKAADTGKAGKKDAKKKKWALTICCHFRLFKSY